MLFVNRLKIRFGTKQREPGPLFEKNIGIFLRGKNQNLGGMSL